jgi:hypothetical protein
MSTANRLLVVFVSLRANALQLTTSPCDSSLSSSVYQPICFLYLPYDYARIFLLLTVNSFFHASIIVSSFILFYTLFVVIPSSQVYLLKMSAITKQTAAPAVTSQKPPSTATKMPITAPVEAAAPIPSKQPQSTAPAGSWAKKLPALTKSSSTAGSAAPNISAGRAPQPTVSQATAASTSSVPAGAGGDSGNQANALSTNGILSFGNGLLDLVEGYEYNEEQIMTFLNTVYNKKTVSMDARYVAKGIQEFILTANNDMTKTLATLEPPKNPNDKAAVHKNAEELRKASEAQLQGPKSFDSVPSIPIRNSALWNSGTEAPPSKDVRQLPFLGVNLPMITVYDYLAWLLSILGSAEAKSAELLFTITGLVQPMVHCHRESDQVQIPAHGTYQLVGCQCPAGLITR